MAANIWQDIRLKFNQGNSTIRLIIVNVAIHLTLALIGVFVYFATSDKDLFKLFVSDWFYFPSDLSQFPLQFWSIFTYMFLHKGLLHLFFNMLALYIFGQKINDLINDRHILPIYIWGGFMGAFWFMVGYGILPPFREASSNLVGASAGVMAIVLATATQNPKGVFFFPLIGAVQLQYIAFFWVILNIIFILGVNPGGAIAHLGGAFMGWLYIKQLSNGRDWSTPIQAVIDRLTRRSRLSKQPPSQQRPGRAKSSSASPKASFRAKMQVHKGSAASDHFSSEYSRSFLQKYKSMSKEECLDSILDKIKRSGYDSLTKDEKVFLDRYRDR